ncbi:helix-turn-helix domain-containing protein [Carnobacterium maltaromaticum]|uniref:helix-turn-helix domain-containing protein n=1 Tax=Carnobacterium maltaromaticum TaxID=2751 RepID=UPI0021534D95|nr:helix-turn-helix transcriptional regulator [Carnobacterium maltaromaticum]
MAENICTQSTISNLENKDRIPTMSILLKLADRLDIELDAILEYALDRELGHNQVFKEVRELCSKTLHEEAYQLLKSGIEFDKLETIYEVKIYYYYMGITSLMRNEALSDVIYYFNLVLSSESEKALIFLMFQQRMV